MILKLFSPIYDYGNFQADTAVKYLQLNTVKRSFNHQIMKKMKRNRLHAQTSNIFSFQRCHVFDTPVLILDREIFDLVILKKKDIHWAQLKLVFLLG